LIRSAQGGLFDILAGLYPGKIPNLDLFLKAHCGDPLRLERKSHPPEYISRPRLTIGLMVLQPAVQAAIAANPRVRRAWTARTVRLLPAGIQTRAP